MGIDADSLYRLDREQSGEAMPVEEFDAWMSRNGLSLTEAAKALGLSRRTIVCYHGGYKPDDSKNDSYRFCLEPTVDNRMMFADEAPMSQISRATFWRRLDLPR